MCRDDSRCLASLVIAAALAVGASTHMGHGMAAAATSVVVNTELQASGRNYDDPCLWQYGDDPDRALACITSKEGHVVECWELPSGAFHGTAGAGQFGAGDSPNNCDVDAGRAEMVATDRGNDRVLVFDLPSLGDQGAAGNAAAIRAVSGAAMTDPIGVCVGHSGPDSLLFVTNNATDEVLVYHLVTGAFVRKWTHNFTKAEAIACDDDYQRVVVCQDEGEGGECEHWTYGGIPSGGRFGAPVFGSDAEGAAFYTCDDTSGYLFIADQRNDEFEIFDREAPFAHRCTFALNVAGGGDRTDRTDGIDILRSTAFPFGLFAACDSCSGLGDELDLATSVDDILVACGLPLCTTTTTSIDTSSTTSSTGSPSTSSTDSSTSTTSTTSTTTSSTTTTVPPPSGSLVNGGFEDGPDGTVGWMGWESPNNRGEVVRTRSVQCDGLWSVQMFDSSSRSRAIYQDAPSIVGGGSYVLSVDARTQNLGVNQGRIVLQWWNGGSLLGEAALGMAPGTAPCATYAAQHVAPAAATAARIILQLLPVTNGVPANDAEVWYDGVSLELLVGGSTTTIRPTTSTTTSMVASTTTTTVRVTTTTAASTTTTTLQPSGPVVANGGFEGGEGGWEDWSSAQNRGEVVRTSAAQCGGAWSVQMFDSSSRTRSIHQEVEGIEAGADYAVSVMAATRNLGTRQARMTVSWQGGDIVVAQDGLWIEAGSRTCQAYGAVFRAPVGVTRARITLQLDPVTDGQPKNDAEVWFDAVAFGRSP